MNSAKLFVIDEPGHGGVPPADRAVRILFELELPEAHPQRVVDPEAPDQRFADTHENLCPLGALDDANDRREHAEHAPLSTPRHKPGRRGLRIQAAIARALLGAEHRGLTFETENAALGI